mmetsp:Transcript_5705/g.13352  ORF Transcript_5705/g.13352 Transcript_5705/m.13352 type:complete len:225 (-) Transcript_5705:294-968(-)
MLCVLYTHPNGRNVANKSNKPSFLPFCFAYTAHSTSHTHTLATSVVATITFGTFSACSWAGTALLPSIVGRAGVSGRELPYKHCTTISSILIIPICTCCHGKGIQYPQICRYTEVPILPIRGSHTCLGMVAPVGRRSSFRDGVRSRSCIEPRGRGDQTNHPDRFALRFHTSTAPSQYHVHQQREMRARPSFDMERLPPVAKVVVCLPGWVHQLRCLHFAHMRKI